MAAEPDGFFRHIHPVRVKGRLLDHPSLVQRPCPGFLEQVPELTADSFPVFRHRFRGPGFDGPQLGLDGANPFSRSAASCSPSAFRMASSRSRASLMACSIPGQRRSRSTVPSSGTSTSPQPAMKTGPAGRLLQRFPAGAQVLSNYHDKPLPALCQLLPDGLPSRYTPLSRTHRHGPG